MLSTAATALAVFLGVTAIGSAQTAPPSPNTTVTVRGCVAPAQRDGSQEARSTGTTPTTPQQAPDEANNGEFVNAYLLLDATLLNSSRRASSGSTGTYVSKPTTFTLQGLEPELLKHKGQRVEITGTVMTPTKSGRGPGNKAVAEGIQRVKVGSIKMVGTDCAAHK
jgi:hypothetical protein